MRVLFAYPYAGIPAPYRARENMAAVSTRAGGYSTHWPNTMFGEAPDTVAPAVVAEALAADDPDLIVPVSETAVLGSALAVEKTGAKGPGLRLARVCTDRRAQREALTTSGLNPLWCLALHNPPPFPGPYVVKAPASVKSRGVRIVNTADQIPAAAEDVLVGAKKELGRLSSVVPEDELDVIVEQYLGDVAYEASGVSTNEVAHLFNTLHQTWDRAAGFITSYEIAPLAIDAELVRLARRVVEILDLKWCAWNIEFRGPPWRVVEVQCRLGADDKGYDELLTDEKVHPIKVVADVFRQADALENYITRGRVLLEERC